MSGLWTGARLVALLSEPCKSPVPKAPRCCGQRVREELRLEQTAGEHLVQHLAGGKSNFKVRSLCSGSGWLRVLNKEQEKEPVFLPRK